MKVASLRAFLYQQGQLLEGEPGTVGMNRRDRPWMTGVHIPEIEERRTVAQLLQQDTVGPHP